MIVKYRACDLCGKDLDVDESVNVKYRAKRHWFGYPAHCRWHRIDICSTCLKEIIIRSKYVQEHGAD